jgi:hypothetical protein
VPQLVFVLVLQRPDCNLQRLVDGEKVRGLLATLDASPSLKHNKHERETSAASRAGRHWKPQRIYATTDLCHNGSIPQRIYTTTDLYLLDDDVTVLPYFHEVNEAIVNF